MKYAQEVILTGCSAGGLATYIHADYVATVLPKSAKFRAMADAGYICPSTVEPLYKRTYWGQTVGHCPLLQGYPYLGG